jgi:Family of unknown function (DUF5678)
MSVIERMIQGQRDLEIVDDLMPYAGQWVAIRDGHVIASGLDPVEVRNDEAVQSDDRIIRVGTGTGAYFL